MWWPFKTLGVGLLLSQLAVGGTASALCRWVESALGEEISTPQRSRPILRVLFLTKDEYVTQAAADALLPTDLIVVDEMPTEVEPQLVAGIISRTEIPALSHLALSADRLKIPLLTDPKGETLPYIRQFAKLESPHVLSIQPEGGSHRLTLEPVGCADCGIPKIEKPPVDRVFNGLLDLAELKKLPREVLIARFGEKIANLVHAVEVAPNPSTPTFSGVPFGVFFQFLEKAKLASFIRERLDLCEKAADKHEIVSKALQEIRESIQGNELPEEMLNEIVEMIERTTGDIFQALRFRSSNDVEDRLGAGIYDSFYLPLSTTNYRAVRLREISRAVRSVWSSLYTFRAFQVRHLYGLPESETAMAILVHASIQWPIATGVASIRNYYGTRLYEFVTYSGDNSATSPTTGSLHETFKLSLDQKGSMAILRQGEKPDPDVEGALKLLPFGDYEDLIYQMSGLLRGWDGTKDPPNNLELSFEWVAVPGGIPVILQVKPKRIPAPPVAEGDSPSLPPEIASKIRSQFEAPELSEILKGLKEEGFRTFPEYLISKMDSHGSLSPFPFFFIEVMGKKVILISNIENHDSAYFRLDSYFRMAEIPLKVIEYGRCNGSYSHSGGSLYLHSITFFNLRDNERTILSSRPADWDDFRAEIEALTLNGLIHVSPETQYRSRDPKYLTGREEGNLQDIYPGN